MKVTVTIEVDVSKTLAETMQRSGFQVCPDGTAMQVKIPNAPPVTKRKTKVKFTYGTEQAATVAQNGITQ